MTNPVLKLVEKPAVAPVTTSMAAGQATPFVVSAAIATSSASLTPTVSAATVSAFTFPRRRSTTSKKHLRLRRTVRGIWLAVSVLSFVFCVGHGALYLFVHAPPKCIGLIGSVTFNGLFQPLFWWYIAAKAKKQAAANGSKQGVTP